MAVFGKTNEFVPNPKQARFLASSSDVLLYGGGAGSGKSLCAIIWLLGLNNGFDGLARYQIPSYNGLIFRKNRKDLSDLIKQSKAIYPRIDPGAKFNNSDSYWKFSSGATIYFSYFERFEQCESQIQGQEYQSIVAEEVGQHDSDDIFLYCISRVRGTNGLKPYLRATANPGRYPWLRDFFRIDDAGNSTKFSIEFKLENGTVIEKKIEYIQAMLHDNPHMDPSYEASLMMMGEAERNALLYGRWDAYSSIEGQIYEHELKAAINSHRICHLPYDPTLPVFTFWDIGISDYTVILFVQYCGKEVRVIDMIKDNNKSVKDYYIPKIIEFGINKGYKYKRHSLPHDANAREKYNGISILDQVRASLNDVEVLPRVDIAAGLQQTKMMFANIWIDKSLELFDDLIHYRREWDGKLNMYKDSPLHDKYSHSADAFRYISYYKNEEDVKINVNDWLKTLTKPAF